MAGFFSEVLKFFGMLFCCPCDDDPYEKVFSTRKKALNVSQWSVGAMVNMEYHEVSPAQYFKDRELAKKGLNACKFNVSGEVPAFCISTEDGHYCATAWSADAMNFSKSLPEAIPQKWWKHTTRHSTPTGDDSQLLSDTTYESFDVYLRHAARRDRSLSFDDSNNSQLIDRQFRM